MCSLKLTTLRYFIGRANQVPSNYSSFAIYAPIPTSETWRVDIQHGDLVATRLKGKYALSDLSSCPTRPNHHAREPAPTGAAFVFTL